MDKKKLPPNSNSSGGAKGKQMSLATTGKMLTKQGSLGASASLKAATTTKIYSSGNSSSTSSYILFWLDSTIDMKDENCARTVQQLQSVISTMHVFNDGNECANFLHTIKNQNVFMVVSGSLSKDILPRIHHMPQLIAVLIYCGDKSKYELLMNNWPKVQGVFTKIDDVCKSLSEVSRQWDEDSTMHISIISGQKLDQLGQSFMYTQLIKEILFELEYNDQNFKELVTYCLKRYSNDREELQLIQMFQNKYQDHTPICWYTRECFLYKLLNKALYKQETDVIIKMGFFICRLHQQIKELHLKQKNQFSKVFTVYRGQGLPTEKFKELKEKKHGLLSFNNFLSSSLNKLVAIDFVDRALKKTKDVVILYNITVDPSISSAPFASVDEFSYFGRGEEEILFSMHTIFRIGDIKQDNNEVRLWHVPLTLTSDSDQQLNQLLERMRVEIGGSSPSYRLGALMIKLGDFNKAEELYTQLLNHTPAELDKANLYYQLGYINDNQGYHDQALEFYKIALKIYVNNLPPNHQNIASCYNNMGLAYDNMKNYEQALSCYQEALKIYQETLPDDDPNVGNCYNSIGMIHNSRRDYPQALSFCKRAFEIFDAKLPKTHPMLATSYNNIGLVYGNMKKYSEATTYYKHAVDIGRQALPDNHPDLAAYRKNLDSVRNK
jgi:tetratricopeptide (TPR) repeat protein